MSEAKAVKTYDDYPMILQAKHIREILGISEALSYQVMNSKKCPTIHVTEKRMVVPKESFFQFLHSMEHESIV